MVIHILSDFHKDFDKSKNYDHVSNMFHSQVSAIDILQLITPLYESLSLAHITYRLKLITYHNDSNINV
jgi:hypothetical protein